MTQHDNSYRNFFSHPRMVKDLLEGFVHEDWVRLLDFDTLEPVNASFVSEDLKRREDDVVWRVRCKSDWLYIYLLIEFQSQPDPRMALRMMVYVGLLYQQLARTEECAGAKPLPPVFPMVLYNGTKPWSGPEEIAELIQPAPGALQRYQPRLRYLLLDESRYPDAIEPGEQGNLAATLIHLENSRAPEDIRRGIRLLLQWLHDPEQAGLRRAFTVWLARVLLPGRLKGVEFPQLNELEEVDAMLAERVKEWTREWEQQGIEKGMQKGMQKGMEQGLQEGRQQGIEAGRRDGEAELLARLLARKFGPLPSEVEAVLGQASPQQLLQWAERVLDAATLNEVIKG